MNCDQPNEEVSPEPFDFTWGSIEKIKYFLSPFFYRSWLVDFDRYHLQEGFQMSPYKSTLNARCQIAKKMRKKCEMHLGGRKVGGCDCVFMRMRYSRPAQSVPFVSLHYCTTHCTQTVHTAHCTLHNTVAQYTIHVEHCNIAMLGQTVLFVSMHCRLQIAQTWSK